jgi:hypothetical protein
MIEVALRSKDLHSKRGLWIGTEMLECRQHLRTACVVYSFTTDVELELRLKTFL